MIYNENSVEYSIYMKIVIAFAMKLMLDIFRELKWNNYNEFIYKQE